MIFTTLNFEIWKLWKEPFRKNPPPTHFVHNSCILHQYCTLPRSFLLPVTILSVLFCTHTSVGMDVISYYGITLLAFPGVSETPRLTCLSGWSLSIESAGFLPGGDHPGHDPLSLAYIQVDTHNAMLPFAMVIIMIAVIIMVVETMKTWIFSDILQMFSRNLLPKRFVGCQTQFKMIFGRNMRVAKVMVIFSNEFY